MISAADKPADAVLFYEENTVPWLISRADKFKQTGLITWPMHPEEARIGQN